MLGKEVLAVGAPSSWGFYSHAALPGKNLHRARRLAEPKHSHPERKLN